MNTHALSISIALLLATSLSLHAQPNNLVMNGSFENTSRKVHSTGDYYIADSISSANNTSVDLFSKEACGHDYDVPANYMGSQDSKTGNNYAGIIAFYADDAGIFRTKPGYRKYSEYIQLALTEPMVAGRIYNISFNISLAEKSAYAVSGMGVYLSNSKLDVQNNAFLDVMPSIVATDIITNTDWSLFSQTYVAQGGERYLTIGCFDQYMDTLKVIPANTNNSRKVYYYIDDVSATPQDKAKEDISMILSGSCYQLDNLHFETDKAVILPESFSAMKSLAQFLKTYPSITVYIDGHTDKTGSDLHNDKLSEDRASAVKNYLINEGVGEKRMKARGHGEAIPIDLQNDNSSINRRVEITICAAVLLKD